MSWKGDPNAFHTVVDGEIAGLTEKASPASGDWLLIEDAADSNNKKKVDWDNLPSGGGGGGRTQLAQEVISSSVANVEFTSFSQSHDDLLVVLEDVESADVADQDQIELNVGNTSADTSSSYAYDMFSIGGGYGDQRNESDDSILVNFVIAGAGDTAADKSGRVEFLIRNYAGAFPKNVKFWGGKYGDADRWTWGWAVWKSTDTIDVVRLTALGGNLEAGTITLYGIDR